MPDDDVVYKLRALDYTKRSGQERLEPQYDMFQQVASIFLRDKKNFRILQEKNRTLEDGDAPTTLPHYMSPLRTHETRTDDSQMPPRSDNRNDYILEEHGAIPHPHNQVDTPILSLSLPLSPSSCLSQMQTAH